MATPGQAEEDVAIEQVLQRLSRTPYACSSLSAPLSTRPANSVYRGFLAQPITAQDGTIATTAIVKHSREPVEVKIFEGILLESLAGFSSPATTTTLIKPPRLYLFDQETNTQVLEEFVGTDGFKWVLYSSKADELVPKHLRVTIGRDLGTWLRSFHDWASAPEQAALRSQMWQNDPVRKTKYDYTFGCFLDVLQEYPELLEGHTKTLETIHQAIAKDFEKPSTEGGEGWGLIHGDFWSGNILVPTTPWRDPALSEDGTNKLFIIDWEFAQFGHRSYDLGQVIGDFYERQIYNYVDNGIPIMEGIIDGYGKLSDDMAFRTAIYVGVHLITWYNRRPKKGPRVVSREVIGAGLTIGRDFVLKGWEKDRKFFEGSALAGLFSAN